MCLKPLRMIRNTMIFCFACLCILEMSPWTADSVYAKTDSHNLTTAIAKVAADNIPAVAHIEVSEVREVNNPLQPFENNPLFHYFFNTPQNQPRKFKQELHALGTGMIMDNEGHILTNNHVVGGASKISVLLADGQRYDATLVGTDPKTDLAVIQIKADGNLPHVTFGDSDKIQVGDWVVAIGHPRGLDQTVTQGIISAKHRTGIMNPTNYQDYLQTDAAINPGNSGGPLLNLDGKVIGVNSAIESQSGGFEGIGFAIPSNMAVHVAKQLIAYGKVERGYLGADLLTLTPEVAEKKHLTMTRGALVEKVLKGGPADAAGIQVGDIITSYQGQSVSDASTLRDTVADTGIGEKVRITVERGGKQIELNAKVGSLAQEEMRMTAEVEKRLGAVVRAVTDQEVQQYNMQQSQGVAIQSLDTNGPLGLAGFEVNDLILAVDNQTVSGLQEFVDMIDLLKPDQRVQFTVLDHRSGQVGNILVMMR